MRMETSTLLLLLVGEQGKRQIVFREVGGGDAEMVSNNLVSKEKRSLGNNMN